MNSKDTVCVNQSLMFPEIPSTPRRPQRAEDSPKNLTSMCQKSVHSTGFELSQLLVPSQQLLAGHRARDHRAALTWRPADDAPAACSTSRPRCRSFLFPPSPCANTLIDPSLPYRTAACGTLQSAIGRFLLHGFPTVLPRLGRQVSADRPRFRAELERSESDFRDRSAVSISSQQLPRNGRYSLAERRACTRFIVLSEFATAPPAACSTQLLSPGFCSA